MANGGISFPSQVKVPQIVALCGAQGFPTPIAIKPLRITPQHNCVYLLTFPSSPENVHLRRVYPVQKLVDHVEIVLHICCRRFERVRVPNEIAVHRWVRANTSIPIPQIAAYGLTSDNPVGFEFIFYEYISGISADKIYAQLDDAAKKKLVEQMTGYIIELNAKPWSHIGSLATDEAGHTRPAPIIEFQCWHYEDLGTFWGGTEETVESLNVTGPFSCYSDFMVGSLKKFEYVLSRHPDLLALHSRYATKIDDLVKRVEICKEQVNQTKYILSHKDLHFGNILVSEQDHAMIVAVIDWELTQVVPVQLWDPGNFLWSGLTNPGFRKEQQRMVEIFEECCRSKGAEWVLEEAQFTNVTQQYLKEALTYLRRLIMSVRWFSSPAELQQMQKGFEDTLRKLGM